MKTTKTWDEDAIPPQHGKLAVITGSTGGIGYEIARALAEAEALIAARNPGKGQQVLRAGRPRQPRLHRKILWEISERLVGMTISAPNSTANA